MNQVLKNMFAGVEIDGIHLSKREAECIFYLIRGMTAKQIGNTIFLSRRTVEGYILTLRNKLHCRTKSELVDKALTTIFPLEKVANVFVRQYQDEIV